MIKLWKGFLKLCKLPLLFANPFGIRIPWRPNVRVETIKAALPDLALGTWSPENLLKPWGRGHGFYQNWWVKTQLALENAGHIR